MPMLAPQLRSGGRRGERGAALLVVITAIAIMTAVAVDLAYNTRVSVQLAANARDELRATYLAKSALNMSRLVLNFQQQLDRTSGAMSGALAQVGGAAQTPGKPGATPAAAANPLASLLGGMGGGGLSIRLWELVPIDSSAAALFLAGGGGAGARPGPIVQPAALTSAGAGGAAPGASGEGAAGGEGTRRAFGDVEGSFHATIEDEDRKINVRQFDDTKINASAQVLRLAQLCRDPKYDFLFDTDDANGIRVARADLFAALKDWQDDDETGSAFNAADPLNPFQNGYGDENAYYDRLQDRYKAKNAAFDSLDELYLVAGVSDAFMAAFGDKLTVYPGKGEKININTTEPLQLLSNALTMADPPIQTATADPAFLSKLQLALAVMRPLPFMSITPQQFAQALQSLGVKVGANYAAGATKDAVAQGAFSDKSSTFHIRAVGTAGEVKKTIDAVVTFDRRAGALAQDVGRLLHWQEE